LFKSDPTTLGGPSQQLVYKISFESLGPKFSNFRQKYNSTQIPLQQNFQSKSLYHSKSQNTNSSGRRPFSELEAKQLKSCT